jgi:hypothetical protein
LNIAIKTFNEDGSIAFEGTFNKEEASLILEVGTNYLLSQGVLGQQEEDDEDEFTINAPTTDTVQ